MDIDKSNDPGDLSSFERRLAEWRPDAKGLHTDRMLYTAGLAAGKRGQVQIAWPALCLFLTLATLASLAWGFAERSAEKALAIRIQQQDIEANHFATAALTSPSVYTPAPNDYLHLRQQIERNPAEWLASSQQTDQLDSKSVPLNPSILKAGQYDRWRDQ